MTDTSKCLRAYAVGDEDVINGSVENYDFDWGEPVTTPDCRCTECSGCRNCCSCGDACVCTPEPEPEPDPDPVECTGSRCGCTASDEGTYPIIDL